MTGNLESFNKNISLYFYHYVFLLRDISPGSHKSMQDCLTLVFVSFQRCLFPLFFHIIIFDIQLIIYMHATNISLLKKWADQFSFSYKPLYSLYSCIWCLTNNSICTATFHKHINLLDTSCLDEYGCKSLIQQIPINREYKLLKISDNQKIPLSLVGFWIHPLSSCTRTGTVCFKITCAN